MDIGEVETIITIEPIPETVTIPEPSPEKEKEGVPA